MIRKQLHMWFEPCCHKYSTGWLAEYNNNRGKTLSVRRNLISIAANWRTTQKIYECENIISKYVEIVQIF